MKILITGANGQLGNALQTVFKDHKLVTLNHSQLDISVLDAVREAASLASPDLIINAAAYNDVEKAESDQAAAFAVNERGPRNLAIAAAELHAPVVHVSTDYVFDGKKKSAYVETDPVNPLSAYAKSKLAGEEAVQSINPKHFIVRTAWVFHTHGKNFLKTLLEASKKTDLKVVNDQISSPTNAVHLAEGIKKMVEAGKFGIHHLAGQGQASRYDQLDYFFKLIHHKAKISPVSMDQFKQIAPRPRFSALDSIHSVKLPSWQEGIKDFVNSSQF